MLNRDRGNLSRVSVAINRGYYLVAIILAVVLTTGIAHAVQPDEAQHAQACSDAWQNRNWNTVVAACKTALSDYANDVPNDTNDHHRCMDMLRAASMFVQVGYGYKNIGNNDKAINYARLGYNEYGAISAACPYQDAVDLADKGRALAHQLLQMLGQDE